MQMRSNDLWVLIPICVTLGITGEAAMFFWINGYDSDGAYNPEHRLMSSVFLGLAILSAIFIVWILYANREDS